MVASRAAAPRTLSLEELVASGDEAAARRDRNGLAEVAHLLCVGPASALQTALVAIEQLASRDVDVAIERWAIVSRSLHDWVASSYVHRG